MSIALAFGMQAIGKILGFNADRQRAIAEGKAMQAQAYNAIRTMNYAFQNLEHERRDAFDIAVANIEKMQATGRTVQGAVDASISEEYGDGGNTGRLLSRSTHGETLRAITGEQDNYRRHSDEIDLNKEQQLLTTKQFTENLHPPKLPSKLGLGLDLLGTFLGARGASQAGDAFKQIAGVINGYNSGLSTQSLPMTFTNFGGGKTTYANGRFVSENNGHHILRYPQYDRLEYKNNVVTANHYLLSNPAYTRKNISYNIGNSLLI